MSTNNYNGATQSDPVVQQPGVASAAKPQSGQWMSIPVGIQNCPPGLEYLTAVDQLLVSQKVRFLSSKNKYKIKNSLGQHVYSAVEKSGWLDTSSDRELDFKVMDNFNKEVLHMHRPMPCPMCFCCEECLNHMDVSAPPGHPIGTIQEIVSGANAKLHIKNSAGAVQLIVKEHGWGIVGERHFKIIDAHNQEIGRITKQWSGLAKELFTDADYFSVTFPLNLDVRMKAILLSAVLLIDMMFYED